MIEPKTYLIGETKPDWGEMRRYLRDTGQEAFMNDVADAEDDGLRGAEILCSFYAKLCYSALVADGRNKNVLKVRSIRNNIKACHDHGHGAVFEHAVLNFVTTDCSRVFTHELVRHRPGMAYSQTSGRFVRLDHIRVVDGDPLLEPIRDEIERFCSNVSKEYEMLSSALGIEAVTDMVMKKKITSALRRIAPQGITNEIGWSANFRMIRHLVMMRTSRHAEWEIRKVFSDVFELVADRFPTVFGEAVTANAKKIDGLWEVKGLKMQPYQE